MSTKLDQALVRAFIAGSFGLPIAHENAVYTPTKGAAFAALKVFNNESLPFDISSTNDITGFLEVALNWPEGEGAVPAKEMADTILAAFPIYSVKSYSGQDVTITGHQRSAGSNEDGWFRILISINFRAFIPR